MNEKAFSVELPRIAEEGISVTLYIPGDSDDYQVETEISEEDIVNAKVVPAPTEPFQLITYFKIKDANGRLKTEFDPAMEMHVRYTKEAWANGYVEDYQRPRLFFLEKVGDGWAREWKEFPKDLITAVPAGREESHSFLYLFLGELFDPLIGGT